MYSKVKGHTMKRLLALVLTALAIAMPAVPQSSSAAGIAPYPVTINSRSSTAPGIEAYRASARTYRLSFTDGSTASSLAGHTAFMTWATSNTALTTVTGTVAVVSSTGGVADVTFSPAQMNFAPGRYIYEAGMSTGGVVTVSRQGVMVLIGSPYAAGTPVASFGSNVNIDAYAWIGTWTTNNIPMDLINSTIVDSTARASAAVALSTGQVAQADIDAHELLTTNAHGGLATFAQGAKADTALQVEADTNALAQLVIETNRAQVAEALLYPRNNPSNYVTASVTNGLLGVDADTLQSVVNRGSGPVTNAPYLVQTNATDVTFSRWRFAEFTGTRSLIQPAMGDGYLLDTNGQTAFFWGVNDRSIYDVAGVYALSVYGFRRTLNASNGVAAADWTDVLRAYDSAGTNGVAVHATLTNHTAQIATLNTPAGIAAAGGLTNAAAFDAAGTAAAATNGIGAAFIASKGGLTNAAAFDTAGTAAAATNGINAAFIAAKGGLTNSAAAFDAAGAAASATNGINTAFLASKGGVVTGGVQVIDFSLARIEVGTNQWSTTNQVVVWYHGKYYTTNGVWFISPYSGNKVWQLYGY
jgi:hypothetical protein